jgi:hypothetical protein
MGVGAGIWPIWAPGVWLDDSIPGPRPRDRIHNGLGLTISLEFFWIIFFWNMHDFGPVTVLRDSSRPPQLAKAETRPDPTQASQW